MNQEWNQLQALDVDHIPNTHFILPHILENMSDIENIDLFFSFRINPSLCSSFKRFSICSLILSILYCRYESGLALLCSFTAMLAILILSAIFCFMSPSLYSSYFLANLGLLSPYYPSSGFLSPYFFSSDFERKV